MDLSANEAFLLCKRSFEEGWVRVEGGGESTTVTLALTLGEEYDQKSPSLLLP